MSLFITLVAIVVAVNALIVTIAALRAPHGYEDESGFHLGREDDHAEIHSIDGHIDTHQEAA